MQKKNIHVTYAKEETIYNLYVNLSDMRYNTSKMYKVNT